jgi:hypothetical protein
VREGKGEGANSKRKSKKRRGRRGDDGDELF